MDLLADTREVDQAGATMEAIGYGLSTAVPFDATGCGSQPVENAVAELGMWLSVELMSAASRLVEIGTSAREAAAALEEADADLARAAS